MELGHVGYPVHNMTPENTNHTANSPINEQASVGDCSGVPETPSAWTGSTRTALVLQRKCPGSHMCSGESLSPADSGVLPGTHRDLLSRERDLFRVFFSPRMYLQFRKSITLGSVCNSDCEILPSIIGDNALSGEFDGHEVGGKAVDHSPPACFRAKAR